ncbi:hypothetical protein [Brevibacillus choshinensis]|uniref:hypothetical protein n=1 Tax=Brevibacillus choshinensis TaxID=54911 RepID=UPI002E21D2EB|nr:hypothetical protein [Brevibacillus choshinensis]
MNNAKVTKKDLYYIITILISIVIAVLTIRLGDNQNVINYFGFAGTLVSIILAIVALIYAFYQSSTYESTSSKLDSSAKKIEEATQHLEKVNELNEVTATLKETYNLISSRVQQVQEVIYTIDKGVEEFAITIQNNLDTIVQTVETKINNVNENVHLTKIDIISKLNEKLPPNKEDATSESNLVISHEFIVYFLNTLNKAQLGFVHYVYFLYKLGLKANFQEYAVWSLSNDFSGWSDAWLNDNEEVYIHFTMAYYASVYNSLETAGFAKYENDLSEFSVSYLDPDLIKELTKNNRPNSEYLKIEAFINEG